MTRSRPRSWANKNKKQPIKEKPQAEEQSAVQAEGNPEQEEEEAEVEEEVEAEEEVEEEEEDEDDEEGEDENGEADEDEDEDEEDDEDEETETGAGVKREDDPAAKLESIRKLLEPFGKDQLIELLKEAAQADPSVVERISSIADSDTTHRKIFVYGLGWDTTSDAVRAAFQPFDEVLECNVVTDRATGKSKGYAFVLMRTRAGAARALQQSQKRIGNRVAACQLASTGPIQGKSAQGPSGRKIYVNNVGPNVDMDRLKNFFSQFGEIEEGPLGYDRTTGKLRGFAIFVYRTVEGCRKVLEEPTKYFEGCQLHCQPALDEVKLKGNAGLGGAAAVGGLDSSNLALAAALLGKNLGPVAGGLAGQGVGIGGLSPAFGATGLSALAGQGTGLGLGGASPGVGSISPSLIGSRASQLALQGLGVHQSSQLPGSVSLRSLPGVGSTGFNPYLGR